MEGLKEAIDRVAELAVQAEKNRGCNDCRKNICEPQSGTV